MKTNQRKTRETDKPEREVIMTDPLLFLEKIFWLILILVCIVSAGFNISQIPVNPDELEHLHAAWLWSQGLHPFVDFFEHHPPAYWVILRPILALSSPKNLFDLIINARILSWLVLVGSILAVGWFFRPLFGKRVAYYGAGLWALFCTFDISPLFVRPDMFMLVLLVTGTSLAMNGFGLAEKARISISWTFLGGLLLGSSICFLTKAVFWLLPFLGASVWIAILLSREKKENLYLVAFGALLTGIAVPIIFQLGWIAFFNDFRKFWYCNVQANENLTGCLLKNFSALKDTFLRAITWPMLPVFLAIPGMMFFAKTKEPFGYPKRLIVSTLCLGTFTLILLGNGPFIQYQLPFLIFIAGFSGMGLTVITIGFSPRARVILSGIILITGLFFLFLNNRFQGESFSLKMSLDPYQYVVDHATPSDTYQGISQRNPVFIMDADPKYFMHFLCFNKPRDVELVIEIINQKKPRFIVGVGIPFWLGAEGHGGFNPPQSITEKYKPLNDTVMERF